MPAAVYVCDKKAEEVAYVNNTKADGENDEPTWPEMQPFHPTMFFVVMTCVYLVSLTKFIEKSYAKIEFLQGAKKLVKYPAAKKPVTAAPSQVVESFDYSIDEESSEVSKNNMC